MTLAERIRQIHQEQNATPIDDLSNEELIDLISQSCEDHYVPKTQVHGNSHIADPDFD